ncbi:MAG TPA: cytochrome c-type biogenesis protein CcmH [Bryobacteraceae bacterium]|jgi:cytochrome c-type biogenesis protein CcmH
MRLSKSSRIRALLNLRVAMFLLVTAICLGESAMDVFGPDVRRIGTRLACLCQTCVETVGTCPMMQCHYSSPARQRIAQMAKKGMTDDQIVDVFVKENGIQALSVPPSQGFNAMVWIMPWIAAALGLGAIAWYVKVHSKPRPLEEVPAATLDHFHNEIEDFEKDMADHD